MHTYLILRQTFVYPKTFFSLKTFPNQSPHKYLVLMRRGRWGILFYARGQVALATPLDGRNGDMEDRHLIAASGGKLVSGSVFARQRGAALLRPVLRLLRVVRHLRQVVERTGPGADLMKPFTDNLKK
jgi:hypothetical protein